MIKQLVTSRRSLIVICVILFLTFLDNTIVSVVLANIQTDLKAGVQDLQWVVDSYMLVFAMLMLTGGTIGDLFGRKKVMLSGVLLFIAGSAVAMLANSVDMLVTGRIIMGVGAAASEPGTLSMIRHLYPEKSSRSRALGVWAAVSGIALAFGPIIGGVIIGLSDWRWVFGFSVVFGALAFIAGFLVLPENSDPKGRKLDVTGLISGAAAISSLISALIVGENSGYGNWLIVFLFALSFVSAIAFIFIEWHKEDPVLPLSFFRKVPFTIANLVAFTANFGIFAVFFFVALYLQFIAGFDGYQIAIAFISMTAAIVVGALFAGRWNAVHHTALLTIFGTLLAGIGIFILNGVIEPNIGTATLAWALVVPGLGFGICLLTMTNSILTIVPAERSGMAASTVNTFRELGGVFGVAVLGSIVNAQLTTGLIAKLKLLGMPANFQTFVIYAITHGGNTPAGVSVSPAILAQHSKLIQQVTQAAYDAFGNGLGIALNLAGALLLLTALIAGVIYLQRKHSIYQHVVDALVSTS